MVLYNLGTKRGSADVYDRGSKQTVVVAEFLLKSCTLK